jgi:hypothetical protein
MTVNPMRLLVPLDYGSAELTSLKKTISVNTPVLIDTFNASDYRSAEYLLQLTQGGSHTIVKAVMVWDLADIAISEYGNASIGGGVQYTIQGTHPPVGGTIELTFHCTTAATTPVSMKYSRVLFDS